MEKIGKIKDGITIDHIAAGKALDVMKILGVTPEAGNPIIMAINVKSAKMGKKDIIKLENVVLDPKEVVDKIKAIAPSATVNLIKDFEVTQKVNPG
ncbi:Aspartate carbamoyltransferase regulatory chain [subsurface metagenome]